MSGSAIIIPNIPINEPHMESDNRMIAGFSPVIFPITRGTMNPSWMVCTTMNTAMAEAMIIQKLSPVSEAFRIASMIVGTKPMI